jgi:hypothetical protein
MPPPLLFIGPGLPWSRAKAEEVAAAQRQHWTEHGFGWRPATGAQAMRDEAFDALDAPSVVARIQPANLRLAS